MTVVVYQRRITMIDRNQRRLWSFIYPILSALFSGTQHVLMVSHQRKSSLLTALTGLMNLDQSHYRELVFWLPSAELIRNQRRHDPNCSEMLRINLDEASMEPLSSFWNCAIKCLLPALKSKAHWNLPVVNSSDPLHSTQILISLHESSRIQVQVFGTS